MEFPKLVGKDVEGWVRRFTAWMQTYFVLRVVTKEYFDAKVAEIDKRLSKLEGL